jgi:predicted transglutaminase-like cysteine proteinase
MTKVLRALSVKTLAAAAPMLALAGFAAAAPSMEIGGLTSQPIGHYDFCKLNPAECLVKANDLAPYHLTRENWQMVFKVNQAVNKRIRPATDQDIYHKDEVWAYPTAFGDCEDYVLLKRRVLIDKGVAPGDVLITVVRKPDGEGHAVLTVRTDRGDFILDNLNEDVLNWEATEYRYLKRQSSQHSGRWVTIESRQDILVGSVD